MDRVKRPQHSKTLLQQKQQLMTYFTEVGQD